jgi:thiamine biosynthesis lipoprotein
MLLDLGAIAKGYAADELVKILKEEGIKRALLNLGGNVYVWGKKDNGDPWLIGVQDPLAPRGNYMGVLELAGNISVVSSGVYERFFTGADGKRYHHIFELNGNGRRGYPVENSLLSTTVIAASSMDADALSTSCFVLGYEKGIALAAAHNVEIIFVEEKRLINEIDKLIKQSPGAQLLFHLEY